MRSDLPVDVEKTIGFILKHQARLEARFDTQMARLQQMMEQAPLPPVWNSYIAAEQLPSRQ